MDPVEPIYGSTYVEIKGLLQVPFILILQFAHWLLKRVGISLRYPLSGLPCAEPTLPSDPIESKAFENKYHIYKKAGYWVTKIQNIEIGLHAVFWCFANFCMPHQVKSFYKRRVERVEEKIPHAQ
jgi:hypothetical protein